jgi:peptidoglycan/xylan/chitin deacetylase (PgdA/CDA1 family)
MPSMRSGRDALRRVATSHQLWRKLMLDRVASHVYGGLGSVLALHRVRPEAERARLDFNRNLEITPEMLTVAITTLRRSGYAFVSMDEAAAALAKPAGKGRFVVFSLDDGYRDNLLHAAPIFRAEGIPFTVYLTTCFPDGKAILWWYLLESLIIETESVSIGEDSIPTATEAEKNAAFNRLSPMLAFSDRRSFQDAIGSLFRKSDDSLTAPAGDQVMTWDDVRSLGSDSLVTIGAHTLSHLALSQLDADDAREEIAGSIRRIGEETGRTPSHFAYPYGGRAAAGPREFELVAKCGLDTAVTTRHGNLFGEHRSHRYALPRIPLTAQAIGARGEFLRLWTSGLVSSHQNRFRRVIVD